MSSKIPKTLAAATRTGRTFFIEVEQLAPAAVPDATLPGVSAGSGGAVDDSSPTVDYKSIRSRGDDAIQPRGKPMEGSEFLGERTELFRGAVDVIKDISESVTDGLLNAENRPSEVSLTLDVGFDAGGNVWLFKAGARANMRLQLKWRLPDAGNSSQPDSEEKPQ
ncbi:MAG: CU044_2847 family protein [Myxococcota bacterium]